MHGATLPAESASAEPSPLDELEADWRLWLLTLFPEYLIDNLGDLVPFAEHHAAFWSWVWSIRRGDRPQPFVAIWPRGGAKSTSAEMACVALGARRERRYGLYICETQDQADDHVQNIAALLESRDVEGFYPDLANRLVGKYGASKGWRRNRLRTTAGLTIDAVGLDSAARGAKIDSDRPDFMVIDDVDGELDTESLTKRKIKAITRKLLPAGSSDLAVLAVQNLVQPDSIFSRLADGRADFLADRIVSGPHPAVVGLEHEVRDGRYVITAGTPTWDGQNLERCQEMVDDFGWSAFQAECQHDVEPPPGGMFDHLEFRRCRWADLPDLVRVVVWVDPAVTNTDQSDSQGINADGLAGDDTIYRLFSWEGRTSPQDALRRAIVKAVEFKAEAVGVETDQGGDTWRSVYSEACKALVADGALPADTVFPVFRSDKAGAGHGPKAHRASLMLADYERGRIVHVEGTHTVLERGLRRFPLTKPFDLVDASYWSWDDLRTVQGAWGAF
jgi:hypothetical protein